MPAHIAVRDLRKRYGGVEALRGVSFEVRRGEVFGLLGPNGAGKTTTLECLVGLRTPDAGAIEVEGVDVSREPRAARERIGVALQTTALQDKITPREALALFGAFYRDRETPAVLLERFALTEKADAAFDTLSVGQRQRLALALAFVNRPEALVLDEPTSGLDPQARRELHEEIVRSKADGRTVLLATHYLEEAEQLCDRIAIVDTGRVIAIGTPRELVAQSSAFHSVRLATGSGLDPTLLAEVAGVTDLEYEGAVVRFRTADATEALARLMPRLAAARVEIVELQVRKATLEDVFLRLTEQSVMTANAPQSSKGNGS